MKPNLIVLLSGEGTTLQAFINSGLPIRAVFSNKASANGLNRAKNAGIQTFVHRNVNELGQQIEALNCEVLVVLAGYMKILPAEFVDKYEIINTHPALLPNYKGLHTHQRVLDAGDIEHGFTIHRVTAELDSGPILFQLSFPVDTDDDANSLEQKVKALEQTYYPILIQQLLECTDE